MPRQKIIRSADVEQVKTNKIDLTKAPPELAPPFDPSDIHIERNAESDGYYRRIRAKQKRDAEVFGNQEIVIEIDNDDDPNAAQFVFAGHNGIKQYMLRGQPQKVKRKYVESFLAGKKVSITSKFGRQSDNKEFNSITTSTAGVYRVTLIEDNHPGGGMKWFKEVMSRPV